MKEKFDIDFLHFPQKIEITRKSINCFFFKKELEKVPVNIPRKLQSDSSKLIRVICDSDNELKLNPKKYREQMNEEILNICKDLESAGKPDSITNKNSLSFILAHGNKKFISNENKNKLIEIIKFILQKSKKNENDEFLLRRYFETISLNFPGNLSEEDTLKILVGELIFEEVPKNTIICKEGDKGEKLYVVIKGKLGVLVQKENKAKCKKIEYIKYLIVIYLYQEYSLFSKIIDLNSNSILLEERELLSLLTVFKYYKCLKNTKFFKKEYDNLTEFILNESDVRSFLNIRCEYPVENSIYLFDYDSNIITELFHFYERKIHDIDDLSTQKNYESHSKRKKTGKVPSYMVKPTTIDEIRKYIILTKTRGLTFNKDVFEFIFAIKEIRKDQIYKGNNNEYKNRLDFNIIYNNIVEYDKNNFNLALSKLKESQIEVKYLYYIDINVIKQNHIFGELSLNSLNNKRTATVISKEECYFAIITKKIYDSCLKMAQIKFGIKKINYFVDGPIFKGISTNLFVNEYFYVFAKKNYTLGQKLFSRGEERDKIYFIVNGELELSVNMTLFEVTNIIRELGGEINDKNLDYIESIYSQFKFFFENDRQQINICIINSNKIAGLDDITLNNKYLFDCKCVSPDITEVYELSYKKYLEAMKIPKIAKNNAKYVNERREMLIKMLYSHRNSLMKSKIKNLQEDEEIGKKLNTEKTKKNKNKQFDILKNEKYHNVFNDVSNKNLKKFLIKNSNKYLLPSKKISNCFSTRTVKKTKQISFDSKNTFQKNNNKINTYENNSNSNLYKNKNQKSLILKKILSGEDSEEDEKKIKPATALNKNKNQRNMFLSAKKQFTSLKSMCNKNNIVETRQSRKIIPFIYNIYNKNKKIIKYSNLLRECSSRYTETRTKFTRYDENFFINKQEDLFNIPNLENNFNKGLLLTTPNNNNLNINLKELKKGYKNKSYDVKKNKNKLASEDIHFYNPRSLMKIKVHKQTYSGVIDCLCLDNWAEKKKIENEFLNRF